MDTKTKQEIIVALLEMKRHDLANLMTNVIAAKPPEIEKADEILVKALRVWFKQYKQHKMDVENGIGSVMIQAFGEQRFMKVYRALKQTLGNVTAARKVKLSPRMARVLRAAAKPAGIVPGGMDATFNDAYRAKDHGLVDHSPNNAQVYVITDKGRDALLNGHYTV